MIEIKNLVKYYRNFKALDNINIQVNEGEVLGLLGANGAGKTTIMRILTGFIPMTDGSVSIAGMDIDDSPKQIKEWLGYVPEHCPLYYEMTVKEFLLFAGEMRGLFKPKLRTNLDYVLDVLDLGIKKNALISSLSKGYKKRVGIAQAIIHDPKVLVLDEPTEGLDPNQIQTMRALIQSLKKNHTIIFSSHILSEVSQICDRIVIIVSGQVRIQGTEKEITHHFSENKVRVCFKGDLKKANRLIQGLDNVIDVEPLMQKTEVTLSVDVHEFDVEFDKLTDPRADIAKVLVQNDLQLLTMFQHKKTLEEAFFRITHQNVV